MPAGSQGYIIEQAIVQIRICDSINRRRFKMNLQRAKEISVSPVMAHVTWNGTPVYIQHVDETNEMARIYPLDRPENEQDVPIRNLIEH
jgi:small acid-soluble spore protein H (minor)